MFALPILFVIAAPSNASERHSTCAYYQGNVL